VALVRAIGERLRTLADAERYGAFALRDELEVDETAWAELRDKPDVGPRLQALAERVGSDPEFTLTSLEQNVRALAAELGVKAGELIGLARVALTGRKVSPGIFDVMWLLGRERTRERLERAALRWAEKAQHGRV
jgi:glutamyl-tRNA synthetase